jgi:glycine amidinotransferase
MRTAAERDASNGFPLVNSFNEWDPLEEVIVGTVQGACHWPWEPRWLDRVPSEGKRQASRLRGGEPFDERTVTSAEEELDEFIHILETEGVVVRRPDPVRHEKRYGTPEWDSAGGRHANPRDVLIVIGDEIIEATMSSRGRYFEFLGYRGLIKEYFRAGAKWTAAPKPQLSRQLYNFTYRRGEEYILTEFEPVFDAADIARCGRDLFVQKSHVTNEFGIEWLRRHLGDTHRVHMVEFTNPGAMHIDTTFVPLAPGKLMVNPEWTLRKMPKVFEKSGWEFLTAPRSRLPRAQDLWWPSMNVLSLDEERVIVEKHEKEMIQALKNWGFDPIPCPFRNNYLFGGSFHCATVDIRRRGTLQSYF